MRKVPRTALSQCSQAQYRQTNTDPSKQSEKGQSRCQSYSNWHDRSTLPEVLMGLEGRHASPHRVHESKPCVRRGFGYPPDGDAVVSRLLAVLVVHHLPQNAPIQLRVVAVVWGPLSGRRSRPFFVSPWLARQFSFHSSQSLHACFPSIVGPWPSRRHGRRNCSSQYFLNPGERFWSLLCVTSIVCGWLSRPRVGLLPIVWVPSPVWPQRTAVVAHFPRTARCRFSA